VANDALSITDAPTAVAPTQGRGNPLMYSLGMPIAMFGLFIALLPPVLVAMALKVAEIAPDNQAGVLGLALGIGAFAAMVANPLAGRFSDRTAGRFGMRRPWIIGGTVIGFAALVVVATTSSVVVLVIGWSVAQIAYNATIAALTAILPDHITRSQRGRVAALLGLAQNLALVGGTFLVQLFSTSATQMIVPGAIGSAVVVLYALLFRDRVLAQRPTTKLGIGQVFGSFVFNPVKHPDLGWAWLTRFMMVAAQYTAVSYLTYFLRDDIGVDDSNLANAVFQGTLWNVVGIVLTSLVAGWLSDRLGRRKLFVAVAGVVGVVGLVLIALAPSLGMVLVGEFVMGAGMGVFYAVDLALITDVLPSDEDNAKDLGVVNIAQALPQSLVPASAPGVIALTGGYSGFFITGAVVGLLGIVSVSRIRGVR
jgi:MFS family permease